MTELGSSRSRPKGAYDVFLSFRAEDTRKNFTYHLYTALLQAGIHTFRDDNELPRGEEISKHLVKAIQESKISIVVFSKGYASSRWCLNELVEILGCKNRNTDQIVLPIFYDIDPSDVRKQTGSFAKAFDKHEERFKEKAKEWRKALEEAGNLSGWSLHDMANGHESKFIQKIVEDVLNKLDRKYLDVATHLVGIAPIVRDISNFLSTTTDDVRMVGVHGMAGMGKTTIAKVVFNQLCYGFKGSCFIPDVKETAKQPNGLVSLQEKLLRDILKRDIGNINNVDRGMNVIKERLCHKRVLVVLDDVDHLKQLNALMRERSWYGPGSRMIITTRNERLLLKVDKKYEVQQFKRDEPLQLFSWHAFGDKIPLEDYAELSNVVVDYCGGLPLDLEVLGSFLSEKDKARWKCVIEKLRKIPNLDIQEKLRISFDTLDDDNLRKTFLDIACFFTGMEKDYVAKVLEARCGFNPEDDLGILIERSLITVNDLGQINMQDLLRDMGREIIRKMSPKHPGKRNRIWHHEDARNVLTKQTGTKVVEGLALDVRASKVKTFNTDSFTKMKHLQLLKINGVHLIGCFKVLPKGLIWLCWHGCPLKSLPSEFELDNLVILDMQNSNIKELWKETKILYKLKILDLSYCEYLVKTPNFLGLPNLERLILKYCTSLVEVSQSIGHLKMLIFLNLEGCYRLKILSESICNVKSLETLNVSRCPRLKKLPERISDLESLTELVADGIENEQLLSSIVHLKHIRKLSLHACSSNRDPLSSTSWVSPISSWPSPRGLNWKALLPTSLAAGWSLLTKLKLACLCLSEGATNCIDLGSLSSLEELDLSGNRFFNLPSGIGCLPKLQVLSVRDCRNLLLISELPSSLCHMDASHCISLERIRVPKTSPLLGADQCPSLMEIEGMKGESKGLRVLGTHCHGLRENYKRSLVEALSSNDYGYGYEIYFNNGDIPNWFSYHRKEIHFHNGDKPNWFSYYGEECSLSFHLPLFFQGLALWTVFDSSLSESQIGEVLIKNKSNDIKLFKSIIGTMGGVTSWVSYVTKSEMAMEEYCGEEIELCLKIWKSTINDTKIKEIGVHVIVEKPDSFKKSEWEWDYDIDNLEGVTSSTDFEKGDEIESQALTDILIPKLYHCLHHPLLGSIASSTREQWITYLLKELQARNVFFVDLWHIY